MCIFCGGTCGGVGDSLLPIAAVGVPFLVMKVRTKLVTRKQKTRKKPDIDSGLEKDSGSEESEKETGFNTR